MWGKEKNENQKKMIIRYHLHWKIAFWEIEENKKWIMSNCIKKMAKCWPILGGYPKNQDIYLRYIVEYQKLYSMDISVGDIRVNVRSLAYYQSWYLAPWCVETMLDIKDVDIWLRYQI